MSASSITAAQVRDIIFLTGEAPVMTTVVVDGEVVPALKVAGKAHHAGSGYMAAADRALSEIINYLDTARVIQDVTTEFEEEEEARLRADEIANRTPLDWAEIAWNAALSEDTVTTEDLIVVASGIAESLFDGGLEEDDLPDALNWFATQVNSYFLTECEDDLTGVQGLVISMLDELLDAVIDIDDEEEYDPDFGYDDEWDEDDESGWQ